MANPEHAGHFAHLDPRRQRREDSGGNHGELVHAEPARLEVLLHQKPDRIAAGIVRILRHQAELGTGSVTRPAIEQHAIQQHDWLLLPVHLDRLHEAVIVGLRHERHSRGVWVDQDLVNLVHRLPPFACSVLAHFASRSCWRCNRSAASSVRLATIC